LQLLYGFLAFIKLFDEQKFFNYTNLLLFFKYFANLSQVL